MSDNINEFQAPAWTLEDAYGSFTDERFLKRVDASRDIVDSLRMTLQEDCNEKNLTAHIEEYQKAFEIISSLESFWRCFSSMDTSNPDSAQTLSSIQAVKVKLENCAQILFKELAALDPSNTLWEDTRLRPWKFITEERRNSWREKIPPKERALLQQQALQDFYPLGTEFSKLQKRMQLTVTDSEGRNKTFNTSATVAALKGIPDKTLRETTFNALQEYMAKHAEEKADLLNKLHGFRLKEQQAAGVDILTPSFEQNRISRAAIESMLKAIESRVDQIRESVSLRAEILGSRKLACCDLMAPAPGSLTAVAETFSYPEGIRLVKEALSTVGEEYPKFIDMMLEKNWIEARLLPCKAGGAFYSRFNELHQTRVFSSYVGTIASVLQQAHELGHAWHYWILRDLPVIETEFPMTLTETSSTFNEAVVKQYLIQKDPQAAVSMLWQELKSIANFLLNVPVRYDFECAFLKERLNGNVEVKTINELMEKAWRRWYGDSTEDIDQYLWAHKLHFYKTDQYIYNYPYAVGYLLSQGLMHEKRLRGNSFLPFYKSMLRDTGRMTFDELVRKHLGLDPATQQFWDGCIDEALSHLTKFKSIVQTPTL